MVRYGNLMAEKMVYLYEQMFYLLCSDENLAILEDMGAQSFPVQFRIQMGRFPVAWHSIRLCNDILPRRLNENITTY